MQLLDFIERNKFSILGTIAIYVSVYVWSNWQVVETYVPQIEGQERVVAVLDFTNEPVEEVVETEQPQINPETGEMMNVSANVTQEKTTYTNSFSKAQTEQEVWDELKAMEAAEFESLKGSKPVETSKSQKNTENQNANLVKENAAKNDKAGYGMDVQAIVTFYLKDRNVLSDKKPSYVCKTEGIVRVTIKVNQKGQVVSKLIDESHTNTSNECLRNAALEYAGLWKFNQNFNDEIRKQGWIEFKYQAQ